jgi:hypothetical protein
VLTTLPPLSLNVKASTYLPSILFALRLPPALYSRNRFAILLLQYLLYFRMNGDTPTVSSILEEVEHVVSGIDYGDAFDDVLDFDEIGQSQRQLARIVSASTDEEDSPVADYDCNDDDGDTTMAIVTTKKRTWRKPEDKPKRPLSAYNLFFQLERERLVTGDDQKNVLFEEISAVCEHHKLKKEKRKHRKTHGKIGFADLARTIASRWRNLKPQTKAMYEGCAATEKARYQKDVAEWVKTQAIKAKRDAKEISNQAPPANATAMPPTTVLLPPTDPPMKACQQNMANIYHQAPSISTSESLHTLMANGRSYTHYQSLVDQQRQMIEVEITQNRRMVQDTQRQIMLASFAAPGPAHGTPYQGRHTSTAYPGQTPSAHYPGPNPSSFIPGQAGNRSSLQQGQVNRPPSFSTPPPRYRDHHDSGPGDYYGTADQTYQRAQMTLRPPSGPVSPPFHMGVGIGGAGMGMGMGMIGGPNRLFHTNTSFEHLGQANEITPTRSPPQPQQVQEEEDDDDEDLDAILDPHTGLSSPTFESISREDPENPRIELSHLLDSFGTLS